MSEVTTTTSRRVRPTLDTPFHIDYSWWERDKRGLRNYLISHLPREQQEAFATHEEDEEIDWVNPETAEVRRVNGLEMALQEAAQRDDFLTSNTSLVDMVFRVLLANGNAPMTPRELAAAIQRSPETILKTLAGATIYKGLRPATDK